MTEADRNALLAVFPKDAGLGVLAPAIRALARHALGDAELPLADEHARYIIEDHSEGFTASLIEDDGFITIHPTLPGQPTA